MRLCACGCGQYTKIIKGTNKSEGRIKGEYNIYISGHNGRNKPRSDITKRKISKNNAMKRPEIKALFFGNQFAKGNHWIMTDVTKDKLSKLQKGSKRIGQALENIRFGIRHKRRSYEGKNNPSWTGENTPYPPSFTPKLRKEIRERDHHECRNCGMSEKDHLLLFKQLLHVHHIDHNHNNSDRTNLITVCRNCNIKANSARPFWEEYYKAKIDYELLGGEVDLVVIKFDKNKNTFLLNSANKRFFPELISQNAT